MTEETDSGRKLRAKERRHYTDEDIDEDEIEGKRVWSLEEKIQSTKYNKKYVVQMKGEEFNLKFIQENGLTTPIIFHDKKGLGLRIPSENFQVSDVKQCVGSRRQLDVMDVTTQKGMEMSMKDWVRYFENPTRERLLNVISLEFSHTRLENYVESPTLVRQIDWVDIAWPQHLKDAQTDSTNVIEKMKYPKVQKYCLMSVEGCYTDFHIDFGGTSVWYHILHGEKMFWLIPPTEKNIEAYESWVLSGKQGDIFLGDYIEDCEKIRLHAGYTFIIPSGWIHAVWTPKDSLVFGGNFLHSFNIAQQLRVTEVEDKTHVKQKFRYPFYAEISWYVLDRYLASIKGHSYLKKPKGQASEKSSPASDQGSVITSLSPESPTSPGDPKLEIKEELSPPSTPKLSKSVTIELTRIDSSPKKSPSDDDEGVEKRTRSPRKIGGAESDTESKHKVETSGMNSKREPVYLTKWEVEGLELLVDWLEKLPPTKKGVPSDMTDPDAVLRDIKQLVSEHQEDDPKLASSGEQIVVWPTVAKPPKPKIKFSAGQSGKSKVAKGSPASSIRRRRTRCKKCEACTRSDCRECSFCLDMRKFGGPGRMKQSCISRQCMAPELPNVAVCMICGEDTPIKEEGTDIRTTTLMECGICWEIVHPDCLSKKYENLDNDGIVNEDLPNSWECSKCCHDGKQGQLKPRVMKGLSKSAPRVVEPPTSGSGGDQLETTPTSENGVEGKRVTAKVTGKPKLTTSPRKIVSSPVKLKGTFRIQPEKTGGRLSVTPVRSHIHKLLKKRKAASPLKSVSPTKRSKSLPAIRSQSSLTSRSPSKTPVKDTVNTPPPPVITRSGRMVKRSPQLSDDGMTTPDLMGKRPRREGSSSLSGSPSGFIRRRNKQAPAGRIEQRSPPSQSYTSTPKIQRGRSLRKRKRSGSPRKAVHHGSNTPKKNANLETTPGLPGNKPSGSKLKTSAKETEKFTRKQKKAEGRQNEDHASVKGRELKLVSEHHVIRPAPVDSPAECVKLESGENHILGRQLWLEIFTFLDPLDLARCLCVCRTWNRWCISPKLWRKITFQGIRVCQSHLVGVVRRQPLELSLQHVVMTQAQLSWLIARLPQLKRLEHCHSSWATISGLCSSSCPLLHSLNLSWAVGLREDCFRDLILPPVDHRPGIQLVSRLHKMKDINLLGTDITDSSLELISQYLTDLQKIGVSYCMNITDIGIASLTDPKYATGKSIKQVDVSFCRNLTDRSLEHLGRCVALKNLNIQGCEKVTKEAVNRYKAKAGCVFVLK